MLNQACATQDPVSLIPYTPHSAVIDAVIKGWMHIRTSDVSPAMRTLDAEAKPGTVVQHEVGHRVPGVDL